MGSALDVFPGFQGMLGSPRGCFQELPRASFPARRSREDSDIRLRTHRPRPDLGALGSGGSFDRLSGLTRVLSIKQRAAKVSQRLELLEPQKCRHLLLWKSCEFTVKIAAFLGNLFSCPRASLRAESPLASATGCTHS